MIEVQRSRERHGWGTHDAHRSRDVAVPKLAARVRAFEAALMIVLFSMHSMYRRRLQSCRVKGTVFTPDFQKLMQSLVVEWAGECHGIFVHDEKLQLTLTVGQIRTYWWVYH